MPQNVHHLMTPIEAENELGAKYFYRQRIYRMAEAGKITTFKLRGQACFLGSHIIKAFLDELEAKIKIKLPTPHSTSLRIFYDVVKGNRIVVDGLFGRGVSVDTITETEEDLLLKIEHIMEWMGSDTEAIALNEEPLRKEPTEKNPPQVPSPSEKPDKSLVKLLPEEISWIRVDTGIIEGVKIKSFVLISLPSIAQFIGIRTDIFVRWIQTTTFLNFVLSAHYKQIQGTQDSVPWKKGVVTGLTPVIPFELVPELIIAFRQSGNTPHFQQKAQLLYDLAKATLEAVGLAMSGNKDKAAEELARVGRGLGINIAEQIIGIFKQYETREFQVETTKKFNSKVKELGGDYAIMTGTLTLGVTGRSAEMWRAFGASRGMPKSSRDVMRALSPADGVGMAFGEHHFTKQPNMTEAIETGRQGKDFYTRLKSVGLLESDSEKKLKKS